MARNPWEDSDPDLAAFVGKPRRKLSILKAWPQLLGVAGLTFVLGYYVPMYRAHESLTKQHAVAAQRMVQLSGNLDETQAKLNKTEEERRTLAARLDEVDAQRSSEAGRLDSLKQSLESGLAKAIRTNAVRLESSQHLVAVALDAKDVFAAGKPDVTPKAKNLLCDVARAAGDRKLHLAVTADEAPPAASRRFVRDARAYAAIRASSVAEVLEKTCRVPSSRIETAGALGSAAGKGSIVRFEIPVAAP